MGHYLWNYLRDTYTIKKSKDVVSYQTQKYKEMMDDVLASSASTPPPSPESSFLSLEEREQMVKELRELATFPDA